MENSVFRLIVGCGRRSVKEELQTNTFILEIPVGRVDGGDVLPSYRDQLCSRAVLVTRIALLTGGFDTSRKSMRDYSTTEFFSHRIALESCYNSTNQNLSHGLAQIYTDFFLLLVVSIRPATNASINSARRMRGYSTTRVFIKGILT